MVVTKMNLESKLLQDFLGQMPWKVNRQDADLIPVCHQASWDAMKLCLPVFPRRILELMETVWKDDLGVAGVPQKRDPEARSLGINGQQKDRITPHVKFWCVSA